MRPLNDVMPKCVQIRHVVDIQTVDLLFFDNNADSAERNMRYELVIVSNLNNIDLC